MASKHWLLGVAERSVAAGILLAQSSPVQLTAGDAQSLLSDAYKTLNANLDAARLSLEKMHGIEPKTSATMDS